MNQNDDIHHLSGCLVQLATTLANHLQNDAAHLLPSRQETSSSRSKPNQNQLEFKLKDKINQTSCGSMKIPMNMSSKLNSDISNKSINEEILFMKNNPRKLKDMHEPIRDKILRIMNANPWLIPQLENLPENQKPNINKKSIAMKFLLYFTVMINTFERLNKIILIQSPDHKRKLLPKRYYVDDGILKLLETILIDNKYWMKPLFNLNNRGSKIIYAIQKYLGIQNYLSATGENTKFSGSSKNTQKHNNESGRVRSTNNNVQFLNNIEDRISFKSPTPLIEQHLAELKDYLTKELMNIQLQFLKNKPSENDYRKNSNYKTESPIPLEYLNVINQLHGAIDSIAILYNYKLNNADNQLNVDYDRIFSYIIKEISQTIIEFEKLPIENLNPNYYYTNNQHIEEVINQLNQTINSLHQFYPRHSELQQSNNTFIKNKSYLHNPAEMYNTMNDIQNLKQPHLNQNPPIKDYLRVDRPMQHTSINEFTDTHHFGNGYPNNSDQRPLYRPPKQIKNDLKYLKVIENLQNTLDAVENRNVSNYPNILNKIYVDPTINRDGTSKDKSVFPDSIHASMPTAANNRTEDYQDDGNDTNSLFKRIHFIESFSDALLDTSPCELINLTDSVISNKPSGNSESKISAKFEDIEHKVIEKRLTITEVIIEDLQRNINKINVTLKELIDNDNLNGNINKHIQTKNDSIDDLPMNEFENEINSNNLSSEPEEILESNESKNNKTVQ